MSVTYNAKIQLKRGQGTPPYTSLDVGEPGFDLSTNKLYVGTGVGSQPVPVMMLSDTSTLFSNAGFIQESSLGSDFVWNAGMLDVSIAGGTGDVTKAYVDGSLAQYVKNTSIGGELYWNNGIVDVSTSLSVDSIQFIPLLSPGAHQDGKMYYDEGGEVITVCIDDVDVHLGREIYLKVYNDTSTQIPAKKVVKITGGVSTIPYATVELTIADSNYDPNSTLLVTHHSIDPSSFGLAMAMGVMYDIDTSTFDAGSKVYLSSTMLGGLSLTSPGFITPIVGKVVYTDASVGKILINTINKPTSGFLYWSEADNHVTPYADKAQATASDPIYGSAGKLFGNLEALDSSQFILNYNGPLVGYNLRSQKELYLGNNDTAYLYKDASNNMVFVDPVAGGPWTLNQLVAEFATIPYVDGSLATKVPYTGATQDISLGTHGLQTDHVLFNLDPCTSFSGNGHLFYDKTYETLAMHLGESTLQIGQENYVYCYNNTASTIPNGKAVYMSGTFGQYPTIDLAIADSLIRAKVLGICTSDIPPSTFGYITNLGVVHDVSTNSFSANERLYLSDTIPGELSNVPGLIWSFVATVLEAAPNGSLLINPQALVSLTGLIDVLIAAPVLNQVLTWNGIHWINANTGTVSAGAGVAYFLSDIESDISTYESMDRIPQSTVEVIESKTLNASLGHVLIDVYASPSTGLLVNQLDGGVWAFNTYSSLSDIAPATYITTNVYKRNYLGVETSLFTATTPSLLSLTPILTIQTTVQPAFVVDPSDRLIFKYYATSDSVTDISINFYHGGSQHYTYVNTPLAVRHNDLAGIQGGFSSERYHMTAAEAVVLGNTTNVNTGDQDLRPYATNASVNIAFGNERNYNASTYFRESSIGTGYIWNSSTHKLDVDTVSKSYVDGSLNAKVNKTGDTIGNVFIDASAIKSIDYIRFNKDWPQTINTSEGVLFWDSSEYTLAYNTEVPGVTIGLGQTGNLRGINLAGIDILRGQVISIIGSSENLPSFGLAESSLPTGFQTVGIAVNDISNNAIGYVKTTGIFTDMNTSSWLEGDLLYLGTAPGSLTKTIPIAPKATIEMGTVLVSSATAGKFLVNITPIPLLSHISDVSALGTITPKTMLWHQGDVWTAVPLNTVNANFSIASASDAVDYTTKIYVDGSLDQRDTSIKWLNDNKLDGTGVIDQIAFWNGTKSISGTSNFIRSSSDGHVALGQNSTDPEATLLINSGVTSHKTVAKFMGTIDNFNEIEIGNQSAGPSASADIVAFNNIGTEDINYIDMGINSTTYGAPDSLPADGYVVLSTDPSVMAGNLLIGNGTKGKDLILFTGPDINAYTNEKIKITFDGSVFIGQPASKQYKLEVNGDINIPVGANYRLGGQIREIVSQAYVDGSLAERDASILWLQNNKQNIGAYIIDGSLSSDFFYDASHFLEVSTGIKTRLSRNVGSGAYGPWYSTALPYNEFRSLDGSHGIILTTSGDGSTYWIDTSVNVAGIYRANGLPFAGTIVEMGTQLFYSLKLFRDKITNTFSETLAAGVTQLPAYNDPDASQGLWVPWGTSSWDASGTSSIISWSNWNVFYPNVQKTIRSSFILDASNLTTANHAVYFNNTTGTPILQTSLVLDRRAYAEKAYIGHINVNSGQIKWYHESPDLYGTTFARRDKSTYDVISTKGLSLGSNADGSTLSMASGSYILEGESFRNIDFFNNLYLGSQHIADINPVSKIILRQVDPSTGSVDLTKGVFESVLIWKKDYYDISTNTIIEYTDSSTQYVLSGIALSDRPGQSAIRKGGKYNTLAEAIADIPNFNTTASPISSVLTTTHPLLGYMIMATDCSTILDPISFNLQSIVNTGSTSSGGGGGIGGVAGAINIGLGTGIYTTVADNLIQLKGITPGNTGTIKLTTSTDTIIIDASIKDWDGSINNLYDNKTDKSYSVIQDASIATLDSSVKYLFTVPQNYVSFDYVDGSFATNASVNNALKVYATNASVGIALYPYATNTSVGLAIAPYATNASVGLAIAPFATNASVGLALGSYATKFYVDGSLNKRDLSINDLYSTKIDLTALYPYATNASVGLALGAYATNASVNIYAVKTDASIIALRTTDLTFATNASVGLALGAYTTNASANLAFANRDASLVALRDYNTSQDASILLRLKEASLGTSFVWIGTTLDVSKAFPAQITMLQGTWNGPVTTSSTTDVSTLGVFIDNVSVGTYLLNFGTSFSHSSAAGTGITTIYVANASIGNSAMSWQRGGTSGNFVSVHVYSGYPVVVSVQGRVEIRWRTSGATLSSGNRYMTLMKIS